MCQGWCAHHFRLGPATLMTWWACLCPLCLVANSTLSPASTQGLPCRAAPASGHQHRSLDRPRALSCSVPPQSLESESGPSPASYQRLLALQCGPVVWVSSLIPLRSEDQFCMISILLNVSRLVLRPRTRPVLVSVPWALERNACSEVADREFNQCQSGLLVDSAV